MLRFLSHGAWRSRSKHRGLHAYPKSTMKLCWTVQVKSRLGWLYSLADLTSSSALRRDFTTSKPEEGLGSAPPMKDTHRGMPSLFNCSTQELTRPSVLSLSLSSSQGRPRNLPPLSLLDSLCW